jgi:hypothetical protein
MKRPLIYRNCNISKINANRAWARLAGYNYEWVHQDYDGPEDNRCGMVQTIEECIEYIDDAYECGDMSETSQAHADVTESIQPTYREWCDFWGKA